MEALWEQAGDKTRRWASTGEDLEAHQAARAAAQHAEQQHGEAPEPVGASSVMMPQVRRGQDRGDGPFGQVGVLGEMPSGHHSHQSSGGGPPWIVYGALSEVTPGRGVILWRRPSLRGK